MNEGERYGMSENSVFPVLEEVAKNAWCDEATYSQMYGQSIDDPEGFWGEQGSESTGSSPTAR